MPCKEGCSNPLRADTEHASPAGDEDDVIGTATCRTCSLEFGGSVARQREHFKSDLHWFNLRMALKDLPTVSQDDLDELLESGARSPFFFLEGGPFGGGLKGSVALFRGRLSRHHVGANSYCVSGNISSADGLQSAAGGCRDFFVFRWTFCSSASGRHPSLPRQARPPTTTRRAAMPVTRTAGSGGGWRP